MRETFYKIDNFFLDTDNQSNFTRVQNILFYKMSIFIAAGYRVFMYFCLKVEVSLE